MKKLFLCAAVAVFGFTMNAQEFKVGANVGLPIGDAGDFYTLNISLDASYLWEVSESFNAGIATGYSHSILDSDFEGDAFSFIPVAGAARYSFSDEFSAGVDLGYAVGLNEGNDGGFYYAPRLQYGISESIDIVAAYRGVSLDGGSFDVITLGVEFGL